MTDVDGLSAAIVGGTNPSEFDLNGDSVVDIDDLNEWLSTAATDNGFSKPYLAGDADLDGTISASDLNRVALNWRGAANKWSDGDFNADGMVDAGDLNSLALNWRESISSAATTSAVPEPSTGALFFIAILYISLRHHRSTARPDA